jgi:hypothetical protein
MRTYKAILGANLGAYAHVDIEANTDAEAMAKLTKAAENAIFQPEWCDLGDFRIVILEHETKTGTLRCVAESEPIQLDRASY